jgi:hypothetical protein
MTQCFPYCQWHNLYRYSGTGKPLFMDTQRAEGWEAEGVNDESLNTASTNSSQDNDKNSQHHKGGLHNNALYAAGMGRPATAQVNPHHTEDLASTGTNVSYEGPTAPGAGGSVGTGYASGQAATGASIASSSDYDQAAIGRHFDKAEGDDDITDRGETTTNGNKPHEE